MIPGVPRGRNMPLSIHGISYVGADFYALDFCCQHFWKLHLSSSWLVHNKILMVWEFGMGEALEMFYNIMSHSKLQENVLFKLFLVIISLLLSWLQMSCSHNTISHAIPLGDFTLLYMCHKVTFLIFTFSLIGTCILITFMNFQMVKLHYLLWILDFLVNNWLKLKVMRSLI